MLAIENLTASYAALSAISDISFALAKGARVGIFGHNGAGKTTLLKCIVGAHTPSRGQVVYDGVPIAAGNIAATVLRGIAFVPQGHNVFPNLSVEQNLKIAGLLFDASFVTQVYELFPVLKSRGPQRARGAKGPVARVLSAHLTVPIATSRSRGVLRSPAPCRPAASRRAQRSRRAGSAKSRRDGGGYAAWRA